MGERHSEWEPARGLQSRERSSGHAPAHLPPQGFNVVFALGRDLIGRYLCNPRRRIVCL